MELNGVPRALAPGDVVHKHSTCGALTRHRGARPDCVDENLDPRDSKGASLHRLGATKGTSEHERRAP
jgi:hypothetical protein